MRNYRKLLTLIVPVGLALAFATSAFAHAVVYPKRGGPGAYEKYLIRVPNERDVATTKVEITFPDSVKVISFEDVPGWTIEIKLDSAKRIIGAVWTGSLAPQRFTEFPFVGVNPKTPVQLTWPVFQTYADGQRVEWTGPEGSEKPASVTMVGVPAGTPGANAGGMSKSVLLAVTAVGASLLLSVVAIIMAMRRREV